MNLALLALALALPLLPRTTSAASFNCGNAETAVEHMICKDPGLSDLDDRLASAYRSRAGQPGVTDAQRQWKRQRDHCKDTSCVAAAYEARLAALSLSTTSATSLDASGKYCVLGSGKAYSMLLIRQHRDTALTFALTSWGPDGSNFSVAGSAAPSSNGWDYSDGMDSADRSQRCAIHFARLAGGYGVKLKPDAACAAMGGYGASRYLANSFPGATRVGDAPASADMDALNHTDCDRK